MAEIVECISRQFQQVERIYADLYGMSIVHYEVYWCSLYHL